MPKSFPIYAVYKNDSFCGHQHGRLKGALNCAKNTRRGEHIGSIIVRKYMTDGSYKVVRV